MGSFLVMRAAVDINNRLQALPYSRLMFVFGCFLYLVLPVLAAAQICK